VGSGPGLGVRDYGEEQGARVFLEPEAASLLDDKVLDASVEQDHVAFTIAEQSRE
jgi:hypothetical protein